MRKNFILICFCSTIAYARSIMLVLASVLMSHTLPDFPVLFQPCYYKAAPTRLMQSYNITILLIQPCVVNYVTMLFQTGLNQSCWDNLATSLMFITSSF